jgi:hypothetical protein
MAEISLSEYANREKPPKKQIEIPHTGLIVAGAIVLAVGGFLTGMQYQKGKTPAVTAARTASSQSSGSSSGGGGFGGGFQRGDRAFGTVSAVSSSSITIQTRSGTTSTYNLTSSTTVTDSGQTSSVSSIQNGDTVILTLDSSNTQNVSSILLNPSFGGGGGPGGYGGQGGQSGQTDSSTSGA